MVKRPTPAKKTTAAPSKNVQPPQVTPPKAPPANNKVVPNNTPPVEGDMEERIFKVNLIQDKKMRNITDLTYNETALNLLILQVETLKENYALTRLSLLRGAMKEQQAATPIAPVKPPTQQVNVPAKPVVPPIAPELTPTTLDNKKESQNTKIDDSLL